MKLLCLSDLHGDGKTLSSILHDAGDADAVLMGGDLTHFGTSNQAEDLVKLAQDVCPLVLAVAGNCDSSSIDQRLTELGVSLFRRGIDHQGVGFYGVSAMPPWMGTMYELSEDEIAAALAEGRRQVADARQQVILSHPPPRNCLDRTRRGDHVGSSAVREMIDTCQPTLVVCGHIHEARGVDRLGETTIVNCGPAFQGNYVLAELNGELRVHLRCL